MHDAPAAGHQPSDQQRCGSDRFDLQPTLRLKLQERPRARTQHRQPGARQHTDTGRHRTHPPQRPPAQPQHDHQRPHFQQHASGGGRTRRRRSARRPQQCDDRGRRHDQIESAVTDPAQQCHPERPDPWPGRPARARRGPDQQGQYARVRRGDQREEPPVVAVPATEQPGQHQQRARTGRILPPLIVQRKTILGHNEFGPFAVQRQVRGRGIPNTGRQRRHPGEHHHQQPSDTPHQPQPRYRRQPTHNAAA